MSKPMREICMKKAKTQRKRQWAVILAAIVAAILFSAIFLALERKVLSTYAVVSVVTAKTEVEKGTQITAENVDTLFGVSEVKKEYVIEGALQSTESLVGQVVENTIHEKEMLKGSDLTDREAWTEEMQEPIEFTFTATSPAACVGGRIRGGDVVDVGITYQKEDGQAHYEVVGRDIYVKEAMSDKGTVVDRSDKESVCTMFRVIMDKARGEALIERLRAGDEVIVTLPK